MFSASVALFGSAASGGEISAVFVAMLVLAVFLPSALCVGLFILFRKAIAAKNELEGLNQDMEAAVKAKGEFLIDMSHEIRTPMNALTSFTEILTQRVSQNCTPELQEEFEGIFDIIKKSSRDLLTIINDVFDYIRIDANLLEIKSIPMSIKQVIHDVCHVEKPNALAKRLDLSIKYIGEIPPTILSDPVRIRQILSNLISNAIKFTEKGTITVLCEVLEADTPKSSADSAKEKESGGEEKDSFSASAILLNISVIDTGFGISPAKYQELFKPFKQSEAIEHRGKRTSGLGLSIAMRLAMLLDGTINIKSTPGLGSTFSLLLNTYVPKGTSPPLMEQEEQKMPQGSKLHSGLEIRMPEKIDVGTSDQNRPLRKKRILVVEDMAVNQVIVATLLRDAGARVELADNGAMGVQKVMQDMDNGLFFDVILMDMQMPVMDGYEATAYLRKHGYTQPIVAVTAHALRGDREKALKAGCDEYIAKPIDNKTLISTIKKLVETE